MGINHYNPIFGMNPHNPSEMYKKTDTVPLDPISVFFVIVGLTTINLVLRRRRK